MESHAQIKQTWSPLQFPSAPLSALTIPKVSAAVQLGISEVFMREYGYLVDHQGHSAFCLEALQGGYLRESDLSPLEHYPNGYGLHQVTNKVVKGIASKVEFTCEGALPDAPRIVYELAREFTDITHASSIALAVAEAGLLHDSDLAPIISRGSDCGYDLLNAAKVALDVLLPDAQRECRNVHDGEVHSERRFYTQLNGNNLSVYADERNCFYLDWPELAQDSLEMHILLSKTLDAMSTYIMPFHTPSSAFSCWAQYSYGVSESYEAVKEDITGKSQSEIAEYICGLDDLEQLGWLGMDLEDDGDGEQDPDVVDRVVSLLWQMDDVERNFNYQLSHGEDVTDQMRSTELSELLSQAREISTSQHKYSALAEVLRDALTACIGRMDSNVSIESLIASVSPESAEHCGSFENSPNRFFDCVWVLAGERHEELHKESVESFNVDVEECGGDVALQLPLASGVLVAQVTIPIMERTNECLALLRRIQLSLEAPTNA